MRYLFVLLLLAGCNDTIPAPSKLVNKCFYSSNSFGDILVKVKSLDLTQDENEYTVNYLELRSSYDRIWIYAPTKLSNHIGIFLIYYKKEIDCDVFNTKIALIDLQSRVRELELANEPKPRTKLECAERCSGRLFEPGFIPSVCIKKCREMK